MNVVFVSPQFPVEYWNFCDRLRANGCTVLGVGDAPYDSLHPGLRAALTEYFRVDDAEDYDQMLRACAYLTWRHGRIDWIESNNEYWLETDARLRSDFNVTTGVALAAAEPFKRKSAQKRVYAEAGVPCARGGLVRDVGDARELAAEIGWPLVAKPDVGVGAQGTRKLEGEDDLEAFLAAWSGEPYVLEEFIDAKAIWSYDAILDSRGEPLLESACVFPSSMMDVAGKGLDLAYHVRDVPPRLRRRGRAVARAAGGSRRCVHLEFFKIGRGRRGLGSNGDFVGLETNMRPAGGRTPDMIDWAHSVDVYQAWADMVVFDERRHPACGPDRLCAYAGRRDAHAYEHSAEEVLEAYGGALTLHERVPQALSDDLGDECFVALFDDERQVREFTRFVQAPPRRGGRARA